MLDETGHKENGDKFWTWVLKTDLYVLFKIDKSRGSKVLIEVLGEEFNGVLGCDYFSAYRKYKKDFNITILFCIAHLIREIKYLTSLPDKETKAYGQQLLSDVKELFKIIHKKSTVSEKDFIDKLTQAKNKIIKTAIEEAPTFINDKGKNKLYVLLLLTELLLKERESIKGRTANERFMDCYCNLFFTGEKCF